MKIKSLAQDHSVVEPKQPGSGTWVLYHCTIQSLSKVHVPARWITFLPIWSFVRKLDNAEVMILILGKNLARIEMS